MTVQADRVQPLLSEAWPGVVVGRPVPLSGGFWAAMFRVPVRDAPAGVGDEVVVRFAPRPEMGAKEAAVQAAAAAQGFPTPQVWLSGPDDGTGGWWSVTAFCAGSPLLGAVQPGALVRQLPALLRRLPEQLATTMAALHRLDPSPVTAAVRDAAADVAWSPPDVLTHLGAGAVALGRDDVAVAVDRLRERMPVTADAVVCHGDFHPFNVIDRGDVLVVVDWTGAVVADPCFDLAFTELLLSNPPMALPPPLRPILRGAGRILARRFVAAYVEANPGVALDSLGWFRALHSARVLVEAGAQRAAAGPAGGAHPFLALEAVAAACLAEATGAPVGA